MAPGIVLPGAYSAAFASLAGLPAVGRHRGLKSPIVRTTPTIHATAIRSPRTPAAAPGWCPAASPGLAVGGGYSVHRRRERRRVPLGQRRADLDADDRRDAGAVDRRPPPRARRRAVARDRRGEHRRDARFSAPASTGSPLRRPARSRPPIASAAANWRARSSASSGSTASAASYAATSRGVWKHAADTERGRLAARALPGAGSARRTACRNRSSNRRTTTSATTWRSSRDSGGQHVLVNCAWRGGAAYNGFYYLERWRADLHARQPDRRAQPAGRRPHDASPTRATASQLYALDRIDDEVHATRRRPRSAASTCRRAATRRAPGTRSPSSGKLASTGSALKNSNELPTGIQAWYNQFMAVDPGGPQPRVRRASKRSTRPRTAASHWTTIGPYWNFGFSCWSVFDNAEYLPADHACRPALDRDRRRQACTSATTAALYARPLRGARERERQRDRLAQPERELRTLQYYSVGVGKSPAASRFRAACRTTADRCCCRKI